jgi:hypothetical protein
MWENFLNVARTAAAFLQEGTAPPNTPQQQERQLEDVNHLASKKFFIIFSSLIMLAFVFYSSVGLLFLIPKVPETVTAFVTIFTKAIEIFGVIISVYLGAQGLVDLRYNSSSNAGIQGEVIVEDKNVNVKEEILTNNAKEEDYNISEVDI